LSVALQIESAVEAETGVTTIEALALPFKVAVTVTVWFAVTVPAVAVKVAVVAPAPTVTEAGTVRAMLVSVSFTVAPPVGAAIERVALQVELAPDTTDVGEHSNPVMIGTLC